MSEAMQTAAAAAASAGRVWPAMSIAQAHALLTAPGAPFEIEERLIRGLRSRVWKNAPATMREVLVAGRAHGDADFLVYENERASFEGFARAALCVAHRLIADGVVKGDRVVIAMRNLPEWPVACFGAVLAGAIATPLNAWSTGPDLQYMIADSGARVAIVDAERWERLVPYVAGCPALVRVYVSRATAAPGSANAVIGPPGQGGAQLAVESLQSLIGPVDGWRSLPDAPLPGLSLDPDDDATLFYTSGTTGRPKGVLGTHRNSTTTLLAAPFCVARNFVRRGEPIPAPAASAIQRSALVSIPFFHTTGCQAILCGALFSGAKLVLMRRWDPEQAMALIERERCTSAGGVPTIAWQLIEHPARERYDLSSLELVSYGGAPAAAELPRRLGQTLPHAAPGTGWGMTETTATFTHHSAEDYINRPDSAGPALPVCDMKIVDDEGRELPVGGIGELWVYGSNVVRGYWNRPEETAQTFVDGWLKTGDIARIDAEGFLFVLDRKKQMLIRGGENIFCSEVEAALYSHPAVMDAGVIGLPHHTLGEEPAAVVTLKPGASASEEELRHHVREQLAAFKVPVSVLVTREPLPRNPSGKLIRKELKRMFASRA